MKRNIVTRSTKNPQASGLHHIQPAPRSTPLSTDRACEYGFAGTGHVLRRVLPGWCLVVPGDS
jgi:hypothetical protein